MNYYIKDAKRANLNDLDDLEEQVDEIYDLESDLILGSGLTYGSKITNLCNKLDGIVQDLYQAIDEARKKIKNRY